MFKLIQCSLSIMSSRQKEINKLRLDNQPQDKILHGWVIKVRVVRLNYMENNGFNKVIDESIRGQLQANQAKNQNNF